MSDQSDSQDSLCEQWEEAGRLFWIVKDAFLDNACLDEKDYELVQGHIYERLSLLDSSELWKEARRIFHIVKGAFFDNC